MQKIEFDLPGAYADIPEVARRLDALENTRGEGTLMRRNHGKSHSVRVRLDAADGPHSAWTMLLQARTLSQPGRRLTRHQTDAAKTAASRITNAVHAHYAELFPISQPVDTPHGQQTVTRITVVASGVLIATHAEGTAHAWSASNLLTYKARLAAQKDLMAS